MYFTYTLYRDYLLKDKLVTAPSGNSDDYCDMKGTNSEHDRTHNTYHQSQHLHYTQSMFVFNQVCVRTPIEFNINLYMYQ